MKFRTNSAIYRNDNIIIDDESVKGKCSQVKEYFIYELASQCMGVNNSYEDIICNGRMIFDLIEELENNNVNDDFTIIVKYNPMGSLCYEVIE